MKEKKNVVAYMRYSSENQRDGFSIEAQQRAIKDYCSRKGWTIVHEYIDEAKTGTSDNREQFQQMIADAPTGMFDGVIVHKFDRFSRDKYDNAIYKRELRNYGIRVYSVLEELDDSPESIILETLLEGMAQYYSENLAREVKKGLKEKAILGQHCGGVAPYGYEIDKITHKLVIMPHEAEIVKHIFEMYANGKAIIEIVEELNSAGYKTKLSKTRGGVDFSRGTIRAILRNEKYTGTYFYRKRKYIKVQGRKKMVAQEESDVITLKKSIPQIVSDDIFDICQARLNASTYNTTRAKVDYLLNGLIVCGECGSPYVGGGSVPRYDKNGKEVARYNYYVCSNRKKKLGCKNTQVSKERIEQACIKAIVEYCYTSEESLELLIADYKKWLKESDDEVREEIARYKAELKKLEAQKSKIISLALDEILSSAEAKEQKNNIEAKINVIKPKIKSLQDDDMMTEKELYELMTETRENILNGSYEDYKELLHEHIEKVEVFPDFQQITLAKVPFLVNPNDGESSENAFPETISDTAYKSIRLILLAYGIFFYYLIFRRTAPFPKHAVRKTLNFLVSVGFFQPIFRPRTVKRILLQVYKVSVKFFCNDAR